MSEKRRMQPMVSKRALFLLLVLAVPAISRAQGNANFSGTWKLAQIDPSVDPRTGKPPGSGIVEASDSYGQSIQALFAQAPQTMMITQNANQVTVQLGSEKLTYTLDGKQTVTPAGDMNAAKTWTDWDGTKLHLHFKKGMNWGRDVLSLSNGKLIVQRDIDSGGGSTTYTLTYTKQ
jgi:hypothetical protein